MNAVGLSAAGAAGGAGGEGGGAPGGGGGGAASAAPLPLLLLLAGQAESGQRAEAHARLDLRHRADGLEGLGGGAIALLLELRLADEQPRLGAHGVVVALRGLRGVGDRGLPALLLERVAGEVERHLPRQRVLGKLAGEPLPGGLLVARPPES